MLILHSIMFIFRFGRPGLAHSPSSHVIFPHEKWMQASAILATAAVQKKKGIRSQHRSLATLNTVLMEAYHTQYGGLHGVQMYLLWSSYAFLFSRKRSMKWISIDRQLITVSNGPHLFSERETLKCPKIAINFLASTTRPFGFNAHNNYGLTSLKLRLACSCSSMLIILHAHLGCRVSNRRMRTWLQSTKFTWKLYCWLLTLGTNKFNFLF